MSHSVMLLACTERIRRSYEQDNLVPYTLMRWVGSLEAGRLQHAVLQIMKKVCGKADYQPELKDHLYQEK